VDSSEKSFGNWLVVGEISETGRKNNSHCYGIVNVKLPAYRAGLPGEEVSFILWPLTPPTRRGLRGTFRSNGEDILFLM